MTERERLVDLIEKALFDNVGKSVNLAENLADHLLKNGVIVLPCKVGDMVYYVSGDKRVKAPKEYEINGFFISKDERYNSMYISRFVEGKFVDSQERAFNNIGKYIFLTREEAEKALNKKLNKKGEN